MTIWLHNILMYKCCTFTFKRFRTVTMTIPVIYLKKIACHENRTCDRLYDSERPKHLSHSIKTRAVTSSVAIVQLHRLFRVQGIGTDALQWTRLWNQLHESVRFYLPLLYSFRKKKTLSLMIGSTARNSSDKFIVTFTRK